MEGGNKKKRKRKMVEKWEKKIEAPCEKVRYKFFIPAFKGELLLLPSTHPPTVTRSSVRVFTHSFVRSIVQLPPLPTTYLIT